MKEKEVKVIKKVPENLEECRTLECRDCYYSNTEKCREVRAKW